MKKATWFALLALIALAATSCMKIPAGYIGLKIDLLGGDKGSITEIPPGKYWDGSMNVEYIAYPLFTRTYGWTEGDNKELGSPNDEAIRFQTAEGMQFTCDIGVTFAIDGTPGTAKGLYILYRNGLEEIISGPLRNAVYKAFMSYGGSYTADQIIGEGKTRLLASVEKDVVAMFKPQGINITSLSWISSPRPPEAMIAALNAKVQATQDAVKVENQVREAKAEAEKQVAKAQGEADSILAIATAQAKANKLLADSLTPALIQMKWVTAWNGVLPAVSSGAGVILDYKSLGK